MTIIFVVFLSLLFKSFKQEACANNTSKRGRLTFRAQVMHRSKLTLIDSDPDTLPGKGRFPSPKRCFPGEKRGFPSEKHHKTISSREQNEVYQVGRTVKNDVFPVNVP